MANIETGEVRRWDSLTDEEKKSGKWIQIPDGTEGGAARPRTFLDDIPQGTISSVREQIARAVAESGEKSK